MSKPLLYDVFSGAGGAGHGYQLAGFRVIGIDNRPQPRYKGDGFIQMDAFDFFDAVARGEFEQPSVWHCSPPCQAHTSLRTMHNAREHADLIPATRAALKATGKPYVIENVPGAPMPERSIMLCGSSFGLGAKAANGWHQLLRHRWFESSHLLMGVPCRHKGMTIGIYGDHARDRAGNARRTGIDFPDSDKIELARAALGIDWMDWRELSQAIPPAYTKWIGDILMAAISQPEQPAPRPDPARPLVVKAAKSTLPAFLARLRAANPGARFAMSEANVALLGTAPDLEAHRRVRDDEAMILSEGKR